MIEREDWGPGPWDGEPDDDAWVFKGYGCEARRNGFGAWCGYVRIPKGHPLFGNVRTGDHRLDAHGTITFAGSDPQGGYWIGFDCGHAFDVVPGFPVAIRELMSRAGIGDYRTLGYVKAECNSLVMQLQALE